MKVELRISNAVANVLKFLAIEILLALLIEPAIAEINRMRAQRKALSGKVVRIRTSFFRRDFSGPAVGGQNGIVFKLLVLFGLLASILATEFAFDYDVRTEPIGKTIMLTGLSDKVDTPFGVPVWSELDVNLSTTLFNLVKCSYRNKSHRYEGRLLPNGECYSGDSPGFRFLEPCAAKPTEKGHNHCYRTPEGLVKNSTDEIELPTEITRLFDTNATYMFLYPNIANDSLFVGKEGPADADVRYCSYRNTRFNKSICLTFLNDTGDGLITGYDIVGESGTIKENVLAWPDFYGSPIVRIGADTFQQPECTSCLWRISYMVDLVASSMQVRLFDFGITAPYQDFAVALAMLAMGFPTQVGTHIDFRFTEQVGYLVVDLRYVLPLAAITIAALFLRLSGLAVEKVIRLPLDYCSAIYYARSREMNGKVSSEQVPGSKTFDVGLVHTCSKSELYLSMNTKQPVVYRGQDIVESKADCHKIGCDRCEIKNVSEASSRD